MSHGTFVAASCTFHHAALFPVKHPSLSRTCLIQSPLHCLRSPFVEIAVRLSLLAVKILPQVNMTEQEAQSVLVCRKGFGKSLSDAFTAKLCAHANENKFFWCLCVVFVNAHNLKNELYHDAYGVGSNHDDVSPEAISWCCNARKRCTVLLQTWLGRSFLMLFVWTCSIVYYIQFKPVRNLILAYGIVVYIHMNHAATCAGGDIWQWSSIALKSIILDDHVQGFCSSKCIGSYAP